MRTAVVVVDVQEGLVTGEHAVPDAAAFCARLDSLLAHARAAGVQVVHLQDDGISPGSPIRRGSPGWDLALRVQAGEDVVTKAEDDGFRGTDLHDVLQARRVDRLIVVGIQSEMCVAATARGAVDHGYAVVLPRDGHTTYDVPSDHRGAIAVPAAHVARVAEWSLGDGIEIPTGVADIDWVE